MPLVLVHNDVVTNPAHLWNDIEGVHYHYPSKYQGKIKTGEPFVYYRGVHRLGGKRGEAQYVGFGRIGSIWPDPDLKEKSRRAWYCGIEDYQRFSIPVPAKIDGVTLEDIPRNLWRDGVRLLDQAVYDRIMQLGNANDSSPVAPATVTQLNIVASDALIIPAALIDAGGGNRRTGNYRKSKRAKEIGDWAEVVVLRYITEQVTGSTNCTHRAAIGETPGWDIDYLDQAGVLQRVEVKGTTAAAFVAVELTVGEMNAAQSHGSNYWLYLVAGCLTESPKVQAIRDPASQLNEGVWSATPVLFSLRFAASG